MTSGRRTTVAVVGAGAAGALTALHLARDAHDDELEIVLVDPARSTGRGVAYSTDDPAHVLNVPAGRMSALSDDPGHFVRWLQAADPAADAATFARRCSYGEYLDSTLATQLRERPTVRLRRVHRRALGLREGADEALLLRLPGADFRADAVVLALGSPRNPADWAPAVLRGAAGFVPDPWAYGALEKVRPARSVLLVGTGLTMVDVALTLAGPGRQVLAVSRSGRLPEPHAARPVPPLPAPPVPDGPLRLPDVRRLVLGQLRAAVRAHGDWRPGLDSLRPVTRDLWQRLPEADRAEFLRRDRRWWDTHRHRMPSDSAEQLASVRARGWVTVHAGCVADVRVVGPRLRVELADGRAVVVDAVVDCTGRGTSAARSGDGLLADLLADGKARPGPLGIGLDVGPDGLLLDAQGRPDPRVVVVGAARQGAEWESTAVPEIRAQAAAAARCIRAAVGRQLAGAASQ
ncbi:FAD/NAD(P)-binding protein [Motilibacter deserti]|uniref:FAD-dependent oxidoreductase n=1 Tax=Motilibacter deserti TaxID=2714956 RepID=A0ABX0GS86_9ACTN|nr:FAD/NAD(P)-binding protein [Motilibacter deserti]NHC12630.1 FAD-dependent oxidoreductase [Motilibacter deserti]